MKKKLGALAGICSRTPRPILPWISATVARVDRPRPTDDSSCAVVAPGRCRLAMPSRAQGGNPPTGTFLASQISPRPPNRNKASVPSAPVQNQAASSRLGAVAIVRKTSAATATAVPSWICQAGSVSPPVSRNSAAPGMRAARPKGHRTEPIAVSRPYSPACASAAGYTPLTGGTGRMSRSSTAAASGSSAPAARPRAMPTTASAITWIRHTANTSPAEAPRQRKVAIVAARASSQARTPLATPIPPTSSAVSPTRVRNKAVWSRNRATPGAASCGSRTRKPRSGKSDRSAAVSAAGSVTVSLVA